MQASLGALEAEPELYFVLQKLEKNTAFQQVAPAGGELGCFWFDTSRLDMLELEPTADSTMLFTL